MIVFLLSDCSIHSGKLHTFLYSFLSLYQKEIVLDIIICVNELSAFVKITNVLVKIIFD